MVIWFEYFFSVQYVLNSVEMKNKEYLGGLT